MHCKPSKSLKRCLPRMSSGVWRAEEETEEMQLLGVYSTRWKVILRNTRIRDVIQTTASFGGKIWRRGARPMGLFSPEKEQSPD